MNKRLTRMLLATSLLVTTHSALADAELNRCLATNKSPNRFEICYGQMRARTAEQGNTARRTHTDNIYQKLKAEDLNAKNGTASQQATPTAQPPAPSVPQSQPTATTQPTKPKIVTVPQPSTPFSQQPQSTTNIFAKPSESTKASTTNKEEPEKADPGTKLFPSSNNKKEKSGTDQKSSYPIQYY